MAKPIDYEARLDKIFSEGRLWKHRTMRTVFDPLSSEYSDTSLDQKIEILKKIVNNDFQLRRLISDYKERYIEQNRRDIASEVEKSLVVLLDHILKDEKR